MFCRFMHARGFAIRTSKNAFAALMCAEKKMIEHDILLYTDGPDYQCLSGGEPEWFFGTLKSLF
jgi:hypothetical protein